MLHPVARSLAGLRFVLLLALFLVAPAGAAASGLGTGATHACAAKTDGTVWCWGSNDSGELGSNGDSESPTPLQVPGISTATAVAAGAAHSCALLADRTVKCWGQNVNGQVGSGTGGDSDPVRQTPTAVTGLTDVTAIAAGGFHTCALKTGGSVVCWGFNVSGQLGNSAAPASLTNVTPVAVTGLTDATAISAGTAHTCALVASGAARCWGSNSGGQLGVDLPGGANASKVPVAVSGASGLTSLSAGSGHTCAVKAAEAVCWGSNGNGQLGDGTKTSRSAPAVVPGLTVVRSVAAGGAHTCAALADGSAKCWGTGTSGELGTGTTSDSLTPATVVGVTSAVEVSAGASFACALLSSGSASCWGDGGSGQTGNGSWTGTSAVKAPTNVPGLSGVTAASTGVRTACAVAAGVLKCWGWGGDGNLGSGVAGPAAPSPQTVTIPGLPGGTTIDDVGVGFGHTCVLTSAGTVYCWGLNQSGQLGNGSSADASGPVQVSGVGGAGVLTDAQQLSVGTFSTCVVRTGGNLACWGSGEFGQLGNSSTAVDDVFPDSRFPVAVDATNFTGPATAVSVGQAHACAVDDDDAVVCWGAGDFGQLGTGHDTSSTPEVVAGVSGASQVGAGTQHSCALVTGGAVKCWGDDARGQLGDGGGDSSGGAVVTAQASLGTQLAVGGFHACVTLSSGPGQVRCWGDNTLGQLGNGSVSETPTASPATIPAFTGAGPLRLGFGTSCTITAGGALACWGDAYYGQLGDGAAGGHYGLTGLSAPVSGLASVVLPPPLVIGPPTNDPPKNDPPKSDPPKSDPPKNDPPKVTPVLQLTGGKVVFTALLLSPTGKACPKKLTVLVSVGKTKQSATVKPKKASVNKKLRCSITATIKLKASKLKKAKSVKVKVSGKGVKTYSKTVKAS